jgi:CheY-like chemotaxis protein
MPSILVVEDDPDVRELQRAIFQSDGYDVTTASNGAEALAALRHRRPCVILLDLMMPVMDGWQFLDAIKQMPEFADLPVLLLSASRQLAATARDNPVKAYLPKPFELSKLLAYIDQYKQDNH